jgi:hypothetical protein
VNDPGTVVAFSGVGFHLDAVGFQVWSQASKLLPKARCRGWQSFVKVCIGMLAEESQQRRRRA